MVGYVSTGLKRVAGLQSRIIGVQDENDMGKTAVSAYRVRRGNNWVLRLGKSKCPSSGERGPERKSNFQQGTPAGKRAAKRKSLRKMIWPPEFNATDRSEKTEAENLPLDLVTEVVVTSVTVLSIEG